MDHSCFSSEDVVCRETTTNDTGNLESSGCICNSSVEKCSNNIIEKNIPQKAKKRGRVFDRNSRAAELEVCPLDPYELSIFIFLLTYMF